MSKLLKLVLAVPVSTAVLFGASACAPSEQTPDPSSTGEEDIVPNEDESDVPLSMSGDDLADVMSGYMEAILTSVDNPETYLEELDDAVVGALGAERYDEVAPTQEGSAVGFIQTEKMTEDEIKSVNAAVSDLDPLVEHVSFEGLDDEQTLRLHALNALSAYGGAVGVAMSGQEDFSIDVEISGDNYEVSDEGTIYVDSDDITASSGENEGDMDESVVFYVGTDGTKISGKYLLEEYMDEDDMEESGDPEDMDDVADDMVDDSIVETDS